MTTFLEEFGDMLHDTITYEPYTGRDPIGGGPSYGSPIEVKCRWVRKMRYVANKDGATIMSSSFVRTPPFGEFDVQSRITLPDGSTPPILSFETSPDENGDLYSYRISF